MIKWINVSVACAALVAGAGSAAHARAEWLKAESEHFVVYGDTSEGAIREYTRKIERFDSIIRVYFPVRSDLDVPPLAIYLADGRNDMRKVWPDIPANVGGFYTPGAERTFAVTGGRGSDNDHTLFHEYAHHFMHQYLPGAYPGWFIEGFAEFFATADVSVGRMKIGLPSEGRMLSLQGGLNEWMPMETLLRSRPLEVKNRGHAYYAQAWALTAYLMSTPERRMVLARYLSAVGSGEDTVAAMQTASGRTPSQLQSDVYNYVQRVSYAWQDREFTPAEIKVTRLPPSARDLIWLDLRLARFVPEEARSANLQEAQRAYAKYPGDGFAALVLAQAHMDMDQNQEAVEVLNRRLSSQADDPQALRMKAIALMNIGDNDDARSAELFVEARSALAAAYAQDPTDYRIYMAMARNRRSAPGYPTENDLQVLLLGSALAPQVRELRVDAARALMARDMATEAVAFLTPIANDPHGGDALQPVRRLLNEARGKAGLTPVSEDTPPAVEAGDDDASPVSAG